MSIKPERLELIKNESLENALSQVSKIDLSGTSLMSLLQFGSGLLLKEAITAEISSYLERGSYERKESSPAGYRNGSQKTTIDTPVGQVEYDRPKVTGAPDFQSEFHTPYMRRPEEFASAISDMYINGVSTRKVKDALKSVSGKKVRISKTTVSRITKRLRTEFSEWKKRDLSQLKVAYLFLDAIHIGMRMGGKSKDAVMVAYAVLEDGTTELVSIGMSNSESNLSWGKFISDLKSRGLSDPILVCSDGNAGLINSINSNFPKSYRQRCVKHREENILDAIPKEEQGSAKKLLKQIFYGATSLAQAKQFIQKFKQTFGKRFPSATEILMTDLDQCLTFYLLPIHHWKRIRTSNKLERLNKEIKRRIKVIGRHPDEAGCLSLIYAISNRYATTQKGFKVDDLTTEVWKRMKEQKKIMKGQLILDLDVA